MGPPDICPRRFRLRNFTASRHSESLVESPAKAASSIHTSAPGPPATSAVATPTMLPVPMVAAKAVISEAKGVTSPSLVFLRASRPKAALRA